VVQQAPLLKVGLAYVQFFLKLKNYIMKTKTYNLTLLAIIIHVVINGQTLNAQTHTIRKDLMSYKNQTTQKQETTNNTETYLQKKAAHLDSIAGKIKAASANRPTAEKIAMLEEAADLQKDAVVEKLKVIELSIKVKEESYITNNKTLTALLSTSKKDIDVVDRAVNYRLDAIKIWNTAKQMLAEANAQTEIEAKLGIMSNAEDEELVALFKQDKAITLLTKYTTHVTLLPVIYVCVK